jgi:hypothetical protein
VAQSMPTWKRYRTPRIGEKQIGFGYAYPSALEA